MRWSAPLTPFATAGDVVQHGAVGQHVRPFGARCVEERRLLVGHPFRIEQERRRLREALGDDVRIVVDDVDRRLVHRREVTMVLLCRELFAHRTLERAARGVVGAPHHVTGAPEDGAVRGAREQQPAGQQRRHADEQRARVAEQCGEPAAELISDKAAVAGAERRHQSDEGDAETDSERREADERAAEEHQPADTDERHRGRVRGASEKVAQTRLDLLADDAPGEAEVEQRREEEPERREPEADQLGVLVCRSGALLLRPLLDARRRARPQGPLLLPGRHADAVRRRGQQPCLLLRSRSPD